ncbi:Hypothetical protein RMHFA_05209 (plasmid) [Roseomonas mucosa]|uniref:hypothetical protein n=1 Tax=Roseomonas TaxID=125216 RepID=UPI000C1A1EDD|nr:MULTISPECIES: hypothetical protein [Roseomonas]ATR19365.1 hypothetical protein CTJ15_03065 [Roseomonas sp. FDAARGOS_362]UZO99500.1 Hypothetical protein RMHFA_05209 [Roseomonas mucosa]
MSADPRRRCLRLHEWPASHRRIWEEFLASRGRRSRRPCKARHWALASITKAEEGWGRFLGFLLWHGLPDPDLPPAALVTGENVGRFFDELRALGNADHTVLGRLQEIEMALQILGPGGDHAWIRCPGGTPVRDLLPMRVRDKPAHHSAVMFQWGLDLMEGSSRRSPRRRQVQLRDGLLIAILAARGYRLRTVTAFRLGQHLRRDDRHWEVWLRPEDTKTRYAENCPLPAVLTPWIDRYVAQERLELLVGRASEAFWINWGGEPLGARGLEKRIRWLSEKRFGKDGVFGPHSFRHGLMTSAVMDAPDDPHLGPTILSITLRTGRGHYDRSKRQVAARRFHDALALERARTAPMLRKPSGDGDKAGHDPKSRAHERPMEKERSGSGTSG